MRSRTIREGSVGLLILVGIGLFGLLIVWLRGFNPGNRSFRFVVEFANVARMQAGAPVRYRGVDVGKIAEIRPRANVVEVEVEIASATLIIPKQRLLVEANQSGLIGETSVDITPGSTLPVGDVASNPLSPECNDIVIVCDGDRLEGQIGVSFDALIRSTIEFTNLFADPVFFSDIRTLAKNTSEAAQSVTVLTREVTGLTQSVRRDLGTLSQAAASSATSVGQAANQFGLTAAQLNSLLITNRATLVSTLNNLNLTSRQLQQTVSRVAPALENGEFIQNLELLSANAAAASANLRGLTDAVGSGDTVLLLQQTLDSARSTFQNAQKITADLDDLTGDPEFRQDLRDLVDGLSGLVSSTQQLQQQAAIAQMLTPPAEVEPEEVEPETESQPAPVDAATASAAATSDMAKQLSTLTLLNPEYTFSLETLGDLGINSTLPDPLPVQQAEQTTSSDRS